MVHSGEIMKTLLAMVVGTASLLATGVSLGQNGNMMNGGTWGDGMMSGYSGTWMPTLLVILVVGLVAWIVMQKRK
jgi:hypothetical protein